MHSDCSENLLSDNEKFKTYRLPYVVPLKLFLGFFKYSVHLGNFMHSWYLHYWVLKMNFSSWWWWWCRSDKNTYWEKGYCQLTLFSGQSFARSFWQMDQKYIYKYFAQSNIRFLLTPLNRSFLSPIFAYDCRISIGSRMELSNYLQSSHYLLPTINEWIRNECMNISTQSQWPPK